MGDVEDYLAALPESAERTELFRLHRLIGDTVPGIGQATRYSMPCYTYRGVAVAAVIMRRAHIAWYPYSGGVLVALGDRINGYSHSPGVLRFTAGDPLPDDLVVDLLRIRMRQIDQDFDA